MPQTISSLSTEHLRTTVTSPDGADLTTLPVHFAFLVSGVEPDTLDWVVGSWEAGNVAKVLVGPFGDVVLVDGRYKAWIKITSNPEIPVVQFDTLTVK